MNVYDPSHSITYVHLSEPADIRTSLLESSAACTPLPSDYANQSPLTRLLRRPAPLRGDRSGVGSMIA